ncbi:hypothetical protein GQ600_1262 [Phytophthora cactorum]|nr:hypothetical protein GQ600_1262 [Phytophthora cactorum]
MEHLGYWADAILARVCDTQREWDLQKLSGEEENASINLIRDNSLLRSVARCIEWRIATPELNGEHVDQVTAIL